MGLHRNTAIELHMGIASRGIRFRATPISLSTGTADQLRAFTSLLRQASHHIARSTRIDEAYRAQASVPTTPAARNVSSGNKSPYCNMAKQQRNPVAWNAYYHCLSR
jgi:hypothetical protein